jgi:hypothetical protein
VRGIYCTKDTFVTTCLQAEVKIAWLENQTGVSYATLRRHYGKWMPREGGSELRKFETLGRGLFSPRLAPKSRESAQVGDITKLEKCEEGDLNPMATPAGAGFSRVLRPPTSADVRLTGL